MADPIGLDCLILILELIIGLHAQQALVVRYFFIQILKEYTQTRIDMSEELVYIGLRRAN